MATPEQKGCQLFQISSKKQHLQIHDVSNAVLSPCTDSVSILYKNGELKSFPLSIENLVDKCVDLQVGVASFCWLNFINDGGQCRLLCQVTQGHLRLLALPSGDSMGARCLYECHLNTLQSLLRDAGVDVSSAAVPRLMSGSHRYALLRVASSVVMLDISESQPPEVRTVIAVAEEAVLSFTGNLMLTVNATSKSDIWDLERGVLMASIDISRFAPGFPQSAHLAESLRYAAFVSESRRVHIVDLEQYFQNNPSHLKPVHNPDLSSSDVPVLLQKRQPENAWKQKLAWLGSVPAAPAPWHRKVRVGTEARGTVFQHSTSRSIYGGQHIRSGFSEGVPEKDNMGRSRELSFEVDCGLEKQSSRVLHMSSTGNILVLESHSDGHQPPFFAMLDLHSKHLYSVKLPSESITVTSPSPTFPTLLLTATAVHVIAPDLEQETLVNRLMVYDSAGIADALCRQNGWDRCTIPIHALEVGLMHRQLDTVAFFLKSRENVFVSHDNNPILPRPSASATGTSPPSLPKAGDLDLGQVEPAIQLLIRTIRKNMTDSQSKQFATQLLYVTLDYLHKVTFHIHEQEAKVRAVGGRQPQFEAEVCEALDKVMGYIGELRQFMAGLHLRVPGDKRQKTSHPLEASAASSTAKDLETEKLTKAQMKLLKNWQKMDEREAITDGILSGEVALLQLHLRRQHAKQGHQGSLNHVVSFGLQRALELLHDKQLLMAAQLFANLGFDVWSKLRQICLYTPVRQLRDYLIEELSSNGQLSTEDLSIVRFARHLESLYSCPSFELAKVLRDENSSRNWEKLANVSSLLERNKSNLVQDACGEIASLEVVNSETASYSHILLEWVSSWELQQQQAIQLDQLITRRDASLTEGIPASVVWHYLLARRNLKCIKQWLDVAFPRDQAWSGQQSTPEWPHSLPFQTDFLTALENCDTYLQNKILDYLAECGIFSPQEITDINLLITRLARAVAVIADEHLLELCPSSHGLELADIHTHIVRTCIDKHLPELLYAYLDFWRLCIGTMDLSEVDVDSSSTEPWVAMLLQMRAIPEDNSDLQRIFEASLSASHFVQRSPSSTHVTVASLLEEGLVGRALATLVYDPEQLCEMMSLPDEEKGTRPSMAKWRSALGLFPRLQTALCCHLEDGVGKQDISVYHLLRGTAPFDVSQLFGWQSTNTLYSGDRSTMPHFSNSDLAAQFGHQRSLQFTYFLRQGRPMFAFCSLIANLLQNGEKTLRADRLKMVVKQTEAIAIHHFHLQHIAAAGVTFLELLAEDSTPLRVHLQAASLILAHESSEVQGSAEQRQQKDSKIEKNIVWLLRGCMLQKRRCQLETLALLEDAVRWEVDRLSIKSSESFLLWQLVVMFCRLHSLPLSTAFLADCAAADDWLLFLTFAQLHNYDKDVVHAELNKFNKASLREHLHYIIENVSVVTPSASSEKRNSIDVAITSRDIRAQLYSRIGVTRPVERVDDSSSDSQASDTEPEAQKDEEDRQEPEDLVLPPHDTHDGDVFGLLLACEEMPVPWRCLNAFAIHYRNPVLAVLAACYKEHCPISCLCSWMISAATEPAQQALSDTFDPCGQRLWDVEDVKVVILNLVQHSLYKTLLSALSLFCPATALLGFVRFCVAFHQYEDQEACRQHLEVFKAQYAAVSSKSEPVQPGGSQPFSPDWMESVVRDILSHLLETVRSSYDLGRLLRLLDQTNVTRQFSCEMPDFSKLYRLHQMINPTGLTLNYNDLALTSDPNYESTCQQALKVLQDKQMYSEARVFAEVAGVSSETITIEQMETELQQLSASAIWAQPTTRCIFWNKCNSMFERHQVSQSAASAFFQGKISSCSSHREKGTVCQLAYDWLEVNDQPANQKLKEDLFVQIWMCKIHDHIEKEKVEEEEASDWMIGEKTITSGVSHPSDLLQYGHIPSEVDPPRVPLNPAEKTALDELIGQRLDRGKVKETCQVAALLGHYSQDLSITIMCLKLALGHASPDSVDMTIRKLIATPTRRLSRRLSSVSSFSILSTASLQSFSCEVEEPEDSTLSTLQLLVPHVKRGQVCCQRILNTYHIAQVLKTTFDWIVMQEAFVVLQALLNSEHPQRFLLAKAFLSNSALGVSQVVGFLSDTILKLLHNQYSAEPGHTGSREGASHASMNASVTSMVMSLIQLCDDPALLGQRLHENISSLTSSNHEMTTKLLSVCVELLVASHHCHTLACSMEGIASVLRSARKLTELLSQAEEYSLLIRLLTGVGRFSEMTYIFDILKTQHQLELLFRKGIDKEEALRMAILEYIQRSHPSDTDTYKMVSLYFTMYREIAAMLEENARRQLAQLKGKISEWNHSEAQATLQSAMHYFGDAAESYSKENCPRHVQSCISQARLVALQLHLLSSSQQVVNLSKAAVHGFIINHSKFWEAYIVAEAYNHHTSWSGAICQRFILHSDNKYLSDLQGHITLTSALITEVAERYRSESSKPKSAVGQMKKLLSLCPEIRTTYQIAQDLGLTDYARDLLKGDSGAYLRDTIGLAY